MTEQEKIEQAANKYCACGMDKGCVHKTAFYVGADYYEKEVMPGQLAKAMEWVSLKGLYQEIDLKWYYKLGGEVRMIAETTEDLLKLYQRVKHNQDAGSENKI